MSTPTITTMYSCHKCGLKDREVTVRERYAGEEVMSWVNHTVALIAADHAKVSPRCRITSLSEIKIPVPAGTSVVGRAPRQ
jgi:C4-type Zn-finger protein